MNARYFALAAAFALTATPALSAGDLSLRGTDLEELVLGTGEYGFGVSQKKYELETGKAYALKIKSTGKQECAWLAPDFAANVWLRKVEAGGIEIKANQLNEIEFEDEGEAEIFFVPVRTGTFAWKCRNMEPRGMMGEFVVK